jgi:hypothetical protein
MAKEQKNYPVTRIPWYRMNACMKLALHYYFDVDSNSEFEHILNNSSGYSLSERRAVQKYFEDEIYPVDKKIAEWMWSLGGERFYFKTLLKQLEENFTISKKKKCSVITKEN